MKRRILIVDDEPNVGAGIRRGLRHEPYEVYAACSAAEALEWMGRNHVDVVIVDEEMPGMRGTQLLAHLAKYYPDTIRFMLTGKASLEVAVAAINEGAINRFFYKPADLTDLAITIRQALQHKDLVIEAMRLLRQYKGQNSLLQRIERLHPGITRVDRDCEGAIVLDETPTGSYEDLIEELRATRQDRGLDA